MVSNERVLEMANIKCYLFRTIKHRKKRHRKHIANRETKGQKSKRQKETDVLENNKREWTNTANGNDVIQACQERSVEEHDRQCNHT